jgi:hypothetical protein
MSEYMLLVYEEEVDAAGQGERERKLPLFVELHRSPARGGAAEGRQGPALGGERDVDPRARCGDGAHRRPVRGDQGTIEVRPVVPADEWVSMAGRAGADVSDEDVRNMG